MKLSAVPTVMEETYKIIDEAKTEAIEVDINTLEQEKNKKRQKKAIIPIGNKSIQRKPLVKSVSLESITFHEVLDTILSLQDTESFWAITLLYEYMEINNCFKLNKITGTELLKMSGYKHTPNQKQRDRILSCITRHAATTINVLDPERTIKNYKNRKTEEGRSYRVFDFLKVERINYSKKNPDLIVSLEDIEFLPGYMKFLPVISRRYIPLEQIRKIPKRTSNDKARHFIIKICFKFASIKGKTVTLNSDQCMNLGKFNKSNKNAKKRIWKPVERALKLGQELNLLTFQWNLKSSEKGIEGSNNLLKDALYKDIQSVSITRTYKLDYQIDLPFNIEKETPISNKQSLNFY